MKNKKAQAGDLFVIRPERELPVARVEKDPEKLKEAYEIGRNHADEASMITGSIGMIPSSSLGASSCGLYEPIHGSAPDIAGKDVANPIGTILSAAMMLRFSFDMPCDADTIENAVSAYLDAGYRTADIMSEGGILVGCKQCGELIIANMRKGC